ncbi:hypothetical protein MJ257_23815 [Paenibacillus timonensis]|uniref:CARDB domain-containing protein n=1 Tax=Paenibacillus timonensis TaxID=225915 RepID=A0ABW3SIN0_9BACL|nr:MULTISPECIES: hypothetical protein [Bacillales]MCH1643131.1 hypothetical protein [Paenibacillus timonensis]
MLKKAGIILAILLGLVVTGQNAFAMEQPNVEVKVISPNQVKDYPGKETTVKAQVTNHTNQSIKDLVVYITMADMGKKWTVNLEDYSADKPEQIKELKPGESKEISLPIRFVYTSNYYLYVTAASAHSLDIYSSNGIPIEIMGNTKIDPTIIQVVSIGTPLIILAFVGVNFAKNRRKKLRKE